VRALEDVGASGVTTVEHLRGRIELVRDAAEAAGRPRNAVGVATQIWYSAQMAEALAERRRPTGSSGSR